MKKIITLFALFAVTFTAFATEKKDSIYTPDTSKCQKRILDLSKRQCFFYKDFPVDVYVSIGEAKTDIGHYYQCFFTFLNASKKTITIDANQFEVTLYRKGKAKKKSGFISTKTFMQKFNKKREKQLIRLKHLENSTRGSNGNFVINYNKRQDTYGTNGYDSNIDPYQKAQRYYNGLKKDYEQNLLEKITLQPKEQTNKQLFMRYIKKVDRMRMKVVIDGVDYIFDVKTNLKLQK
jgi:hypothetical protein